MGRSGLSLSLSSWLKACCLYGSSPGFSCLADRYAFSSKPLEGVPVTCDKGQHQRGPRQEGSTGSKWGKIQSGHARSVPAGPSRLLPPPLRELVNYKSGFKIAILGFGGSVNTGCSACAHMCTHVRRPQDAAALKLTDLAIPVGQ